MDLDADTLRAIAHALEVIRDALDDIEPGRIDRSQTISEAVQLIGEVLNDPDLATSAGPAETFPPD